MPISSDKLYDQAIQLPHEAKVMLIEKILKHIGENMTENVTALQVQEAKRRRDQIRSGETLPVPGEQALQQVRDMIEE